MSGGTARDAVAILYAVDDGYALPAAVSGRSLQENLGEGAAVAWYVLELGLPSVVAGGFEFPPQVFGYLLTPAMLVEHPQILSASMRTRLSSRTSRRCSSPRWATTCWARLATGRSRMRLCRPLGDATLPKSS